MLPYLFYQNHGEYIIVFTNDLPYFIKENKFYYISAGQLFWKTFFYLIELRLDGIQLLFGILQQEM
jgi:hypothetical protein